MAAANSAAYHQYYAARRSTPSSYKQSQSARQSYPLTHYAMSMPRAMHEPPIAAMHSTLQTHTPPTSVDSSFGSVICDDSQYLSTLPSAVSDFPASEVFLWRDAKLELPLGNAFAMTSDGYFATASAQSSPDSVHNAADSCHEQSLWPPCSGSSSFRSTEQRRSPDGVPGDCLGLDSNGHCPKNASLSTPALPVAGGIDNISSTRSPSLLAVEVDASSYDIVQDEQWTYSVKDYEDHDSASPASIDTHSSGPRTPADAQPNAPFFHVQNSSGYDGAPFDHTVTKAATSFGSFSSTTSQPPPVMGHLQTAAAASSFGNLTFNSAICSQPGPWPMVHATGIYQAQYGVQTGISGLVSNYEIYQGVQPAAIQPTVLQQPVFHAGLGSFQDFADAAMETTSEDCNEEESESDADDRSEENMNDRALHDAQVRRDRDKFLLKMRNEGFSYKEIKRRGNFREAESTLRGRVRVLTKDKAERVRRPEWTEEDIELLDEAVTQFSGSQGQGRGRVRDGGRLPWKKVSEYLVHHGSTYHFAAATCARKWKELASR